MIPETTESREREYPPPHPGGVSSQKPIDAAKEAVTVLELAERLAGKPLTHRWQSYVACCPLPDHEDRSPSFTVYGDNAKGWWCFGCGRGGDVVHLFALARGHDNLGEAAGYLLLEFGYQPPQRPPSWFGKQDRQQAVRDAIEQEKIEHIRMLVFRLVWVPWLRTLPAWVRDEAKVSAWEKSRNIALLLYKRRAA
jgi:CHC2 zinc finger